MTEIASLEEFRAIPPTPLSVFRDRALRYTLAEPSNVDWIVGAGGGQSPARAAMVENADEGAIRYDVLADAVKGAIDLDASTVCVAVSTPERRYFASEVATILIAAGTHAHVFTDKGTPRTYERLVLLEPTVVVMLSPDLSEDRLPETTKLAMTFNREHRLERIPQLDVTISTASDSSATQQISALHTQQRRLLFRAVPRWPPDGHTTLRTCPAGRQGSHRGQGRVRIGVSSAFLGESHLTAWLPCQAGHERRA